MPSLNAVHLIGNLTSDPEIKYTPKGTAVTEIGLAINRNYTTESGEKREECTFVNITFWGRTAELVGEYCKKGNPLYVGGRLSLDQWDDKQTGTRRTKLKVIGDSVQFLGGRPEGDRQEPAQQPGFKKAPPPQRKPPADPDLDFGMEDDVPF